MNKSDLKKLIKPLIKECIHEVLLEEGLLSSVVSEVAKGLQQNVLVESKVEAPQKQEAPLFNDDLQMKRKNAEANLKLKEHRQKLLESINKDAYNGVDLFEGTAPLRSTGKPGATESPNILGEDPSDAGVDISSLVGDASKVWQAIK
jgi:hypothetical protein